MFGPNFHFYTLFESSKDSQVCRYYSYRILTSFVFKKYWKSKEDEWNEEVANPSKKGEIIEVEASLSSSKACCYNLAWRGEHGQVGELFNMDPLPWLLPRFLYKLKSLNREPHLCHPCGKSKYIHVQMIIGLHCILHLV